MTSQGLERWAPAWMALVRTYARLWDQVEAQMRQDAGLTMSRYDVLMQLDLAGGRPGLSELATNIMLSPSGVWRRRRLGPSDLASTIVLSPPALPNLLDRVEPSALIRRDPPPDDARSTYAVIT